MLIWHLRGRSIFPADYIIEYCRSRDALAGLARRLITEIKYLLR